MIETHIIWQAVGRPVPCDAHGEPIPTARGNRERCARCGAPEGDYSHKQIVSTNFIPTRNANRLRTFCTRRYCAACVFCSKALRLRCISWFATEHEVTFWRTRPVEKGAPRPDALATLLDPPKPPFVVGLPLYGISHGGEANYQRTWWPGEPMPSDPLKRLQSKHVALYSRTAFSRDRYPVQVDDQADFVLDRDVWLRARESAHDLVSTAIADGISPYPAKLSLLDLTLPRRSSSALAMHWQRLTAPLRSVYRSQWWPIFVELLPTQENPNETTRKSPEAKRLSATTRSKADPQTPRVPASGDGTPGQQRLPW